jgi:hypothetical protein
VADPPTKKAPPKAAPVEKAPSRTPKAPAPAEVDPPVGGPGSDTKLSIPSAPEIAPSEILDQVVVLGVGGGEHVCDDPSELCAQSLEEGAYLTGLGPDQRVIIMMYQYIKPEQRFLYYTDWESTIGPDGTLQVEIPNLNFFALYVVLDASTRTFLVSSVPLETEYKAYYSNKYSPCTDADYKTRLKLGDKVRVAYVNGANLRLRSSPDHSSLANVIGGIPEGTEIYIDSGPACAGGWIFWKVYYQKQYGWVSEGDGTDWLLEPWK